LIQEQIRRGAKKMDKEDVIVLCIIARSDQPTEILCNEKGENFLKATNFREVSFNLTQTKSKAITPLIIR